MTKDDLTATSFLTSRLVTFLIALTGFLFLFQPEWMGWKNLVATAGGEARLNAMGLAIGFFLLAALSHEKNQLRVRVAELMLALNQLLYGKNYVAEREMIETMIANMEAGGEAADVSYKQLCRLTGQSFAADPKVWRSWWEASKKRFELKR